MEQSCRRAERTVVWLSKRREYVVNSAGPSPAHRSSRYAPCVRL